jgi:hypothetical protein
MLAARTERALGGSFGRLLSLAALYTKIHKRDVEALLWVLARKLLPTSYDPCTDGWEIEWQLSKQVAAAGQHSASHWHNEAHVDCFMCSNTMT